MWDGSDSARGCLVPRQMLVGKGGEGRNLAVTLSPDTLCVDKTARVTHKCGTELSQHSAVQAFSST